MAKKQCFMPFFYDWIKPLSLLSKEDCGELVLAMVKYHQNGGEIPEFTGMTGMAADFIFPQLMRAKEEAEHQLERARLGGIAKQKQFLLKQDCNLPTNTNTNTITNTTTITNTNTNTTDLAEDTADSVGCVSVSDSRFDIFWEAYPKKQNKAIAKRTWDRLDPDDTLFQKMLDALEWQKKTPTWALEDGRYIPAPSSWLAKARWEDEQSPVRTPPAKQSSHQSSFDANEFFQAALRRSMAVYEQTSGEYDDGE